MEAREGFLPSFHYKSQIGFFFKKKKSSNAAKHSIIYILQSLDMLDHFKSLLYLDGKHL